MKLKGILKGLSTTFLAALLSACGGGGGSSPGVVPVNMPDDESGVPVIDVVTGECNRNLVDVISANGNGSALRLENLSNGCDYLVDRDTTLRADVVIDAGVAFALEAGVNINFQTENVELQGSISAPVIFQPIDMSKPWGTVDFSRGGTISYTLFNGGGANSIGNNSERAMVVANAGADNLSIENSHFTNSVSAGLELRDGSARAETLVFEKNTMASNADVGLIVSSRLINFIDASSDYADAAGGSTKPGIKVAGRYLSAQIFRDLGTPFLIEEPSQPSGQFGGVSIRDSVIEAGVEIVIPDGTDISMTGTLVNGTSASPVILRPVDGSDTGWGSLIVERNNNVRNILLNEAGSLTSTNGGALSVNSLSGTLENIAINNSRSWGVVCVNRLGASDNVVRLAGLAVSQPALGDTEPNCEIDNAPIVTDMERQDVTQCTETLLGNDEAASHGPIFVDSAADCDYYVVGRLSVGDITIQPGTNFIFARGASMTVGGFIVATGTADKPIEMVGEELSSGYWNGVSVTGASFELSHTVVESGGLVDGAGLLLKSTRIRNEDAIATISRVIVSGSNGNGLEIGDNIVLDEFAENQFTSNQAYGLQLPLKQATALDNGTAYDPSTSVNGLRGIRLSSVSSLTGGEYTLRDLGVPWSSPTIKMYSASTSSFTRPENLLDTTLTLEAGVSLFLDENAYINAVDISRNSVETAPRLQFNGTAENPVTVSGPMADPASWLGVFASTLNATYTIFSGGGSVASVENPIGIRDGNGGLIFVSGSVVSLDNVAINNSRGWGIDCTRSGVTFNTIANMTYQDNTLGNVNPTCSG